MNAVSETHSLQLIIAALALLGGCVAIFIGRRGIRVGDHPICRRCGFDLVGLPAGSAVCSECGADLRKRRAVLIGHHQRRWAHLLLGLGVVVTCIVVLGRGGAEALQEVNWYRLSPNWVLIREASSKDSQTQQSALGELARRAATGKLAGRQLAEVVDRALDAQADAKIAWEIRWGQIIEGARANGNLPDDKWRRYLRQAILFQIELRPVIRRGDFLVMRLSHPRSRVGGVNFKVKTVLQSSLLSRRAEAGDDGSFRIDFQFGAEGESTLLGHRFSDEVLSKLRDGPQNVDFQLLMKVYDPASDPTESSGPVGQPLVTDGVKLTAKWTLLPANMQSVKTVIDPSLRTAMRASVLPQKTPELHRFKGPELYGESLQSGALLRFDYLPPTDCMFDVFLRSGNREWKAGQLQYCSAEGDVHVSMLKPVDADKVDVILRPNPQAATQTLGITRIWGEDVVIPNVKVVDDQK